MGTHNALWACHVPNGGAATVAHERLVRCPLVLMRHHVQVREYGMHNADRRC